MAQQRRGAPLSQDNDVSQRQRDQPVTGKIFVIAEYDIQDNREMNRPDQRPSLRRGELPDDEAQHHRQQKGVENHREGTIKHEHLDQQGQPAQEIDKQQLRFREYPIERADRTVAAYQQQKKAKESEVGRRMQFLVEISAGRQVMDLPVGQHG